MRFKKPERHSCPLQRFTNLPYSGDNERQIARQTAHEIPMLMLFKQIGTKELGWRNCPFWWSVLYTPTTMQTVVFASDITDDLAPRDCA